MTPTQICPSFFYKLATGRIVRVVSIHNGIAVCDTFDEEKKQWRFRTRLHNSEMFVEEVDDPLIVA